MTVPIFIEELPANESSICKILHDYLMAFPKVRCKIRYKIPFYDQKSWFCYLNPQKKGGVELAFTRANEMGDYPGVLDFKGRKQIAGIYLSKPQDIDFEVLGPIINDALLLDEMVPYQSKNTGT